MQVVVQKENVIDKLFYYLQQKSRKALFLFKKNALSDRHYERFVRAHPFSEKRKTEVRKIGDYIILRTTYYYYSVYYDEYREYHGVYIIGVDNSTGKLFCHRLPWNEDFENDDFLDNLTVEKIKKLMGFDKDLDESDFREGERVRVQGDLVCTTLFTFTLERLKREIVKEEKKIRTEKAIEKIAKEIYQSLVRVVEEGGKDKAVRKALRKEFKKRRLNLTVEDVISSSRKRIYHGELKIDEMNIFFAIKEKEFDRIKRRIRVDEREVLKKLLKLERIYKIHIGNHIIHLTGIFLKYRPDNIGKVLKASTIPWLSRSTAIFLIVRPQTIYVTHDEHGVSIIPVQKPCVIQFQSLRQHIIHAR